MIAGGKSLLDYNNVLNIAGQKKKWLALLAFIFIAINFVYTLLPRDCRFFKIKK